MKNSFDIRKASENCSASTIEYLTKAQNIASTSMFQMSEEVSFSEAFLFFTRLSLLITRRRPELAVHCVLMHVMPHIADIKINEISRLTVNKLINPLVIEGKIVQSRRVFSIMKQFLGWCVFQGFLEISPLAAMSLNKVAGGQRNKPRERSLSDAEIWFFWHLWDQTNVSEGTRWAARLVLCAARRPDEVLRAKRSEFDLLHDVWNQGNRNKSNREHSLPISPIMKMCIEHLMAAAGDSEWLVPSTKKRDQPMSKVALSQAMRRILEIPTLANIVKPFNIRDLRRTARSCFSRLGIPQEVSRKIMNHSLVGIDKVYDQHDYMDRMREAMSDYSDLLMGIIDHESYANLDHRFRGDRLAETEHFWVITYPSVQHHRDVSRDR